MSDGRVLMIAAMLLLAVQDGLSRHLAGEYSTILIVTIRYWLVFALVLALAIGRRGVRASFHSARPLFQALRGVLLAVEICVMVAGFVVLGLTLAHAVFAVSPLLVTAAAAPLLKERVRPVQWALIGMGFAGMLVILRPGSEVFTAAALIPFLAACLFAAYSVATRMVADRDDAGVSFSWMALMGVVVLTPVGIWFWEPLARADWLPMGLLALSSAVAHWLLIRAYAIEAASRVQPFAYFHLVFASIIGVAWFGEMLTPPLLIGAGIVVVSGLLSLRVRAERTGAEPA